LVPFVAHRLARPYSVFVNRHFDDDVDWIERFAYLIPSEVDIPAQFTNQNRIFLAERYGGKGIAHHGGGVRCGLDGRYQIKGIGCNPLVGHGYAPGNSAFWHSHGGVALVDAIQETAWGEVFHHALPYGAVRIYSLIATGTECWFRAQTGCKVKAPRALIVREAALRPAHFERATFFRPRGQFPYVSDTERVRAAIQCLPMVLPLPIGSLSQDIQHIKREDLLAAGALEMARRFATQCAAAKAKRLMHGTLNASNISIDGKWLDYGTASALPNYANTKNLGLPPHLLPFWEEQENLAAVLNNLCFYISKYFSVTNTAALPTSAPLTQFFHSHYETALDYSFARLAGFPDILVVSSGAQPELLKLGRLFIAIARTGVEKAFTPAVPDLEKYGANCLGSVLLTLARWYDEADCGSRLTPLIQNENLRTAVVRGYRTVAAKVCQEANARGMGKNSVRQLCLLGAAKSAKSVLVLNRQSMAEQCRQLLARCSDQDELSTAIQSWVEDVSDWSQMLYADAGTLRSLCWKRGPLSIYYDATQDAWRVEDANGTTVMPREAVEGNEALSAVRNYWDERAWKPSI
jgi:hypothetical protein